MSTPMYELPEHCWISVNSNGEGPAYDEDFFDWVCWCAEPGCNRAFGDKPDWIPHEEF